MNYDGDDSKGRDLVVTCVLVNICLDPGSNQTNDWGFQRPHLLLWPVQAKLQHGRGWLGVSSMDFNRWWLDVNLLNLIPDARQPHWPIRPLTVQIPPNTISVWHPALELICFTPKRNHSLVGLWGGLVSPPYSSRRWLDVSLLNLQRLAVCNHRRIPPSLIDQMTLLEYRDGLLWYQCIRNHLAFHFAPVYHPVIYHGLTIPKPYI